MVLAAAETIVSPGTSYAVIFKIHYFDAFVGRQLERLKAEIGSGHLYVMADETRGPVGEIPHDRVIRVTEGEMLERGYAKRSEQHAMYWHASDYSLYRMLEGYPRYDYYLLVEFDAVINGALDTIVAAIAAKGSDFVGEPLGTPVAKWFWTKTCDKVYDLADLRPYLTVIAFFSYRAVTLLRDRRLALSRRFLSQEIDQFPLSEAFIATEVFMAGLNVDRLSDFGNTAFLDWWPPYEESELDALAEGTFVHPILDHESYLRSLLRKDQLGSIFHLDSRTVPKLMRLPPREYIPELLLKLANRKRAADRAFTIEQLNAPLFEMPEPSTNIAKGKPATQSSVSRYSRFRQPSQDAAGAVNGLATGTFGFHTGKDDPPWWMVDLEEPHVLDAIWVYNRLYFEARTRLLTIYASEDGRNWTQIFSLPPGENFGGVYGTPLMVALPARLAARFIRIEAAGKQHLHLDQVKIFGTPASLGAPVPKAST